MKKKYFACAMGLVLALSLTACGEEEVIVENTNEEVTQEVQTQEVQTQEVQTQEVAEAPTETVADRYRSRGRSPVTGGSYGNPGSEWYGMELCRRYDRWC